MMNKRIYKFENKESFEIKVVKVINNRFEFKVVIVRNNNIFSILVNIYSYLNIVDMINS